MTPGKKLYLVIMFLFVFIIMSVSASAEKSVYVISNTETSQVQVYQVDENNLIYQTGYFCKLDPPNDAGAVGVAIDKSEYGNFLFFTLENTNKIEIVNAKTMQYSDYVKAIGAINLAGIVVDSNKGKLYTMDRQTNHLYSYSWNAQNRTLTPDFPFPYYVLLPTCSYAFGIALDETNSRLYVADNTNKIKYYNTNTWSKAGEITASCNVVSMGIDVPHQLLYYGKIGYNQQGDTHLYKYNILTQEPNSVVIGSDVSVAGIAVDQETSLVYITTFGNINTDYPNPPQDRLMIYNSSLVKQSFESGDIGNPAGVAVAADVGYKEPNFIITKDNNDVQTNCVSPGDYVTFNITWDANDTNDTNVFVKDYLPVGLQYIYSEPDAIDYNSTYNIVTWHLPDFNETSSGSLRIIALVNSKSIPCKKITNVAMIEGDNYYCIPASADVNICPWTDIVYVDVNSTSYDKTGTAWEYAYKDLQDAIERVRECGCTSQIWIAKGTYKPTLNPLSTDVNFALVNGVSLYGHFAGNEKLKELRNFASDANKTILDGLIDPDSEIRVDNVIKGQYVNNCTIDGFTIQNAYSFGINITDSNIIVQNCKISDTSDGGGISASKSSILVKYCVISDNQSDGLYVYNVNTGNYFLTLMNSIIKDNGNNGIVIFGPSYGGSFTINIINNWILNNGTHNNSNAGITIFNHPNNPIIRIRNNTICRNNDYGIRSVYGAVPNISNCIIYYNVLGDYSNSLADVNCYRQGQHPNDPPGFRDPNNLDDYHISSNSPCKNTGNSNGIPSNEKDIDGEGRIKYEIVDIGADEYYKSPDFDEDGDVDFRDYAVLAKAWMTETGEPNYADKCDLDFNVEINAGDLKLFCFDWLWKSPWVSGLFSVMDEGEQEMMIGFGTDEQMILAVSVQEEEKIILTESDVKETLEWMDKVQLEAEKEGLLTDEGYTEFRQILEKDLMSYVETSEK